MTFRHNNIYLRNIKKEFQILTNGLPETKIYTICNVDLFLGTRSNNSCSFDDRKNRLGFSN